MPIPKTVCRTILYNKIVQLEVCITFSGKGMGMHITAHILRLSLELGEKDSTVEVVSAGFKTSGS